MDHCLLIGVDDRTSKSDIKSLYTGLSKLMEVTK
jgi:hypothetical protein